MQETSEIFRCTMMMKPLLTSAVNQMSRVTDAVTAVILNLSAFLLPLSSLDRPHLQSSNVTHKLAARVLFSFNSSNGFVIMHLPRGNLCSHFGKMKELKSVHSWIHFRNKPPIRQNIMKEDRVTEDFSDRKLRVQPQHVLCTFCLLWWFDLAWREVACQSLSITPLLNWTGKTRY